jgi:hypothetical protein
MLPEQTPKPYTILAEVPFSIKLLEVVRKMTGKQVACLLNLHRCQSQTTLGWKDGVL